MKLRIRNIFIPALLLPLAACNDNAPEQTAEKDIIHFSAPAVVETTESRATPVQSSLPEGSIFAVNGYCIPLSEGYSSVSDEQYNPAGGAFAWDDKSALAYPDVMNGATLTIGNSGCSYTSTSARGEWYTPNNPKVRNAAAPADFKYSFLAYAPASNKFSMGSGVGAPKLTYAVEYPCEEDAMYAFATDQKRENGDVKLQFHHILSGLSVKINNFNNEDITVNSLTLNGKFYTSAVIDFSASEALTSAGDAMAQATMPFFNQPVTVAKESALTVPNVLFVLPNPKGADSNYLGSEKTITGSFTYKGETIEIRIPKEGDNFNFSRIPKPGVNYTLNLNFTGSEVKLLLSTGEEYWETDEGYSGNLNFN